MKLRSVLVLFLVIAMLCSCSPSAKTDVQAPTAEPETPAELTVSITNSSGYIFNELYISPTASNDWGKDLLGSTSVLKKGGSYEVVVPVYDFNNYDIRIVDEDDDTYLFERVPMHGDCTVDITWENELMAEVSLGDGSDAVSVSGELVTSSDSSSDSESEPESTPGWIEMVFRNDTSWVFDAIYIFEEGNTDSTKIGYNHIANGALHKNSSCDIGVDWLRAFDIIMIDEEGDGWYFKSVNLEEGCFVSITFDGSNAKLTINYTNGTYSTFLGTVE